MQLTIDTLTDTPAQLSAAAAFLLELAGKPKTAVLDAGKPASTATPPAPASANASESPSPAPAVPSDTPAASVSAAEAVANAGSLDKAGFPWDSRIHTASKSVIGDGTWRKSPGVDKDLVIQVRAEWTNLVAQAKAEVPPVPNDAQADAPDSSVPPVPTGATAAVEETPPPVPAAPTLTAQDVLARCSEIQMQDASKGAALYQAVVSSGVAAGPMGLMAITDQAVLSAALAAVNAVAGA